MAGSRGVKRGLRLLVTYSSRAEQVFTSRDIHYTDLQDLDGSSYRRPTFSSVGHHGDVPVNYYMRLCRWRERPWQSRQKSHILGVDCDQDSVAFSPCNERGRHRSA
jgi:hypothetical protein